MRLDLIIQETTAGLSNQYVSENLDISNSSIKACLADERMKAAQIANQSTVYSIQLIDSIKVYSCIHTNITDFTGRSGYYAIKLFVNKECTIKNIVSIFNDINDRYLNFKKIGQLNSQKYDDILANANIDTERRFICPVSKQAYFSYYLGEDDIDGILNQNAINAIEKLYVFDKYNSRDNADVTRQGLVYFDDYTKNLEQFDVVNTQGVLKTLYINNSTLSADYFLNTFSSFKKKGETVYFDTKDDSNKRPGNTSNGTLTINRKVIYQAPVNRVNPVRKKEQNSNWPFLALLAITLIGGVIYSIVVFTSKPETQPNDDIASGEYKPDTSKSNDSLPNEIVPPTKDFKFLPSSKDTFNSKYNNILKKRFFFRDGNKCMVKNKDYPKEFALVDDNYIKNRLKITEDSVVIFKHELEDVCSCKILKPTIAPTPLAKNTSTTNPNTILGSGADK